MNISYLDKNFVNHEEDNKHCCLKVINGITVQYFIKIRAGHFMDPYDSDYIRQKDWQWQSVTNECADFYKSYLKTATKSFLRRAERSL